MHTLSYQSDGLAATKSVQQVVNNIYVEVV